MIKLNSKSFNNESLVNRAIESCVASVLAASMLSAPAFAGEIAGLPANTPPTVDRPLEFAFSNDLLGRGGSVDDFRTQQFIITGEIGERWEVTVDHSILTLVEADEPGRTDQLSASLGYRLFDTSDDRAINRLTTGLGLRGYGDFGGERIQNGSHQLVRSSPEIVPYTDLDRTDGTLWVDAQRTALFKGEIDSQEWRYGYWLRGSALWASDGQLDAALGAYLTAGRRSLDMWLGLRHDWRSGYEEPVLIESAFAEEDLAAVFGLRWGPIIFETVQQFDNKASYGQIRLVAAGFGEERAQAQQSRFALDAGITIPDVMLNVTGRHRSDWLNRGDSTWQRSLFVTGGYGEPQHDDDPSIYRRTVQAGAGVEWEKSLGVRDGWASIYGSVGAGWRQERVFAYENKRISEESDTVSRGALLAGLGLRFDTGELISRFNFRIQLGLSAWIPFSDASLDMDGESFRVQRPSYAITLGLTLGRFTN
jgi:hypothetical protein